MRLRVVDHMQLFAGFWWYVFTGKFPPSNLSINLQ
jgi:hypothetical protein